MLPPKTSSHGSSIYQPEENLNPDQSFLNQSSLTGVRQRIKERQKKFDEVDRCHTEILQLVDNVLGNPINVHATSHVEVHTTVAMPIDLKDRLQIMQECNQELEKALQIANRTLVKIEEEHQNIKRIQQEQKDIERQILIIQHDLRGAYEKTVLLELKQINISQNLDLIQEKLGEASSNFNLFIPRLEIVFLNVFQIQLNQEEVSTRFNGLSEQSQMIQIHQVQLGRRINALMQPDTSLSGQAVTWIVNTELLKNPIVKESMQKLAVRFKISPEKPKKLLKQTSKKAPKEIKREARSITSYLWANLTYMVSKTISYVAYGALKIQRLKEKIVLPLTHWVWLRT